MKRLNHFYQFILSLLVPGSALSAIARPCPIAAMVCAVLAIALAWDQHRALQEKKLVKDERFKDLEKSYLDTLQKIIDLESRISAVDYDDIKSRSEEIRSVLSTLKLNNLYRR